jgi:hypothetical protein
MVIIMTLKAYAESELKKVLDGSMDRDACLKKLTSFIGGFCVDCIIDIDENSCRFRWEGLEELDEIISSDVMPEPVRAAALATKEGFFRKELEFFSGEKEQKKDPMCCFLALVEIYKGIRTSPALKEPAGRAALKVVEDNIVHGRGYIANHSYIFDVLRAFYGRIVSNEFILRTLLGIAKDRDSPIQTEARKLLADIVVDAKKIGYETSSAPKAVDFVKEDVIARCVSRSDAKTLGYYARYKPYNSNYCVIPDSIRTAFGLGLAEVLLRKLDLEGLKAVSESDDYTKDVREAAAAKLDPAVIDAEKARQKEERIKRLQAQVDQAWDSGTIDGMYCYSLELAKETGVRNPEQWALLESISLCRKRGDIKKLASFLGRNDMDDMSVLLELKNLVQKKLEMNLPQRKEAVPKTRDANGSLPLPKQFRCAPSRTEKCDAARQAACMSGTMRR